MVKIGVKGTKGIENGNSYPYTQNPEANPATAPDKKYLPEESSSRSARPITIYLVNQ